MPNRQTTGGNLLEPRRATVPVDPIQDGLRDRPLKGARNPSPRPSTKRTELTTKVLGREPEQLPQNLLPFPVDDPQRLEHHGAESVVSAETDVVLHVLPHNPVVLTGIHDPQARL